jgi:molybdopterin converting factor small subunit
MELIMTTQRTATVQIFGALDSTGNGRNQPLVVEVTIPASGCKASVLARELDLPLEKIEAVSVNHQIYSLDHHIQPGDRVAFVPNGTPGPSRGLGSI